MMLSRRSFPILVLIAIGVVAATALFPTATHGEGKSPKSTQRNRHAVTKVDGSEEAKTERPTLQMSKAIACRSIDGYEQYEPLKDVELTSDEKLLVYFRPLGYAIIPRDQVYVVHFSQDGRIRRKGEKATIRFKPRLLDLESVTRYRPDYLYLRNLVSLKDLPPGDYEFDIILRDENAPGHTATQSIGFRVVKAKDPKEIVPETTAPRSTPDSSDPERP